MVGCLPAGFAPLSISIEAISRSKSAIEGIKSLLMSAAFSFRTPIAR
jgi:hypothetical protein